MTAYNTGSDSIKISDLRSKVKATVTQYPFLHLHEVVEGLYFHCSLSVCVSVCLSVCVSGNSCEQNSVKGCTDLDAIFAKCLLPALAQTY